jgi:hypothetical protein
MSVSRILIIGVTLLTFSLAGSANAKDLVKAAAPTYSALQGADELLSSPPKALTKTWLKKRTSSSNCTNSDLRVPKAFVSAKANTDCWEQLRKKATRKQKRSHRFRQLRREAVKY